MYNAMPNRLKAIRQSQGKTIREVAAAAGISPTTLCSMENMRVGTTLSTACRLADILGVTLDEMLGHRRGEKYIK